MSTSSSSNSNKDNVFDLGSSAFASDHFRMHEFKVKRCPRARPHDWTQCPFAHPGEKARRRDPRRYRYSGTACPEFRKSGCCRRGDACPFAHGVFECWLHPSRYRTQLCTDGSSCKRRVCFFAHCESELRRPEDDPVTAERQVQAELAAEVQVLQQQHLAQALQTIFDASGVNGNGGAHPTTQPPGLALELLKQLTGPQAAPLMGTGEPANGNGANALISLLQQLSSMQAQQPPQQQQQQPSQQQQQQEQQPQQSQPQSAKQQASATVPAEQPQVTKSASDASTAAGQENLQMALKQVLEQQAAAAPAVSGMPPGSVAMSFPSSSPLAAPISMAATGRGVQLDNSQLLQLDPNILGSLLEQTTAARARMPPARHSIDNSFLAAKILGMSGQMDAEGMGQGNMMPMQCSAPPQSQVIASGLPLPQGQPDARQVLAGIQHGHFMNGDVGNGTVNGIPLDHNLGLSSQLLQLDPALLNSLAMRARQAGAVGGSHARVVDNNFLARMNNVDMSGIVNGVVAQPEATASAMVAPGVPVQNTNDVQANLLQGIQNGALASHVQALLQGLNLDGMKPDGQSQFNAMSTYDKGTHHERVASNGEGSVLMPSNMLQ